MVREKHGRLAIALPDATREAPQHGNLLQVASTGLQLQELASNFPTSELDIGNTWNPSPEWDAIRAKNSTSGRTEPVTPRPDVRDSLELPHTPTYDDRSAHTDMRGRRPVPSSAKAAQRESNAMSHRTCPHNIILYAAFHFNLAYQLSLQFPNKGRNYEKNITIFDCHL